MARKFLFVWIIFITSIVAKGQEDKDSPIFPGHFTAIEKRIIDTIIKLPECRKEAAYIKRESKGKRRLSFVIYQRPSKEYPFYWVKAWEDNGGAYATYFNFYVYPRHKHFNIKYLDTLEGGAISLKEWRKQRKS